KADLLREGLNSGGLIVFYVENGVELRNLQQVVHLLCKVQQFELAALVADGRKGTDQLANSGAVDIGHIAEIQQDLLFALAQQLADLVAQQDAAFAESDTSAEIHDGHAVNATAV